MHQTSKIEPLFRIVWEKWEYNGGKFLKEYWVHSVKSFVKIMALRKKPAMLGWSCVGTWG